MPAPLAENRFLSLMTLSESTMIIGNLCEPIKEETILVKAFVWLAAVSLFRKILETAWPAVPDEVMVLKISDSGMLTKSYSLNSLTGKNGISE